MIFLCQVFTAQALPIPLHSNKEPSSCISNEPPGGMMTAKDTMTWWEKEISKCIYLYQIFPKMRTKPRASVCTYDSWQRAGWQIKPNPNQPTAAPNYNRISTQRSFHFNPCRCPLGLLSRSTAESSMPADTCTRSLAMTFLRLNLERKNMKVVIGVIGSLPYYRQKKVRGEFGWSIYPACPLPCQTETWT